MENIYSTQHQKRPGTSGVCGQLYETKLLSLINFRMEQDDDIEEFYVGANVNGLGDFDDICFKFRSKVINKTVAVFIQVKHRNDENKALALTATDLTKYFNSYLEIRRKFRSDSSDVFFRGSYNDVECAFVFYTNSKDKLIKTNCNENDLIEKVNSIIATGDGAFRFLCTDEHLKQINKTFLHESIKRLAMVVANIVRGKSANHEMLMCDEIIQTYHVILARKVFNIADDKGDHKKGQKYRIGTFKPGFYKTCDENFMLLKEYLFCEIITDNKPSEDKTSNLLSQLFSKVSVDTISPLIGGVITYKNNTFEFVNENMNNKSRSKERLQRLDVIPADVEEAKDRAAIKILDKVQIKLPPAFGNSDVNIRGSDCKIQKRLTYLADKIVELLNGSKERIYNENKLNVVDIDDQFPDKGFIRINGGIGSAVGNLLILDDKTNLLKFDNSSNLSGKAKMIFTIVNKQVCDLQKYRFDVKVVNFPKLTIGCDEHQKNLIEDFSNKFVFYTNQANHSEVANILKKEIAFFQKTLEQSKLDTIFLTYHDAIQKWWMEENNVQYLTKNSQLFQNTTRGLITNTILRCIEYTCRKNWCIDNQIQFNSEVLNSIKFDESKVNIIVTEVISLSSMKVTQCLTNCVLIDLDYISSLPQEDCIQLNDELRTVKDKTFVLTCNSFPRGSKLYKIYNILERLKETKLILVTNDKSVQDVEEYYPNSVIITDDKISLTDLTSDSQNKMLSNATAMFQGVEVDLNLVLDADTKALINGNYLNQIMRGESIKLGEPLTNSRYENIKSFYIPRKVGNSRHRVVNLQTFNDINDHTVLITGPPGMGKSSLLTDLSLQTKARYPEVWIIRINLLDYSRFFYQWKEQNTVVNILEALRLICVFLVDQKRNEIKSDCNIVLKEENMDIFLEEFTGVSEIIMFDIIIFLNFCNHRKVLFIFDGFDEICPHYEIQVIQLLKVLKLYAYRIWVSSRNYNQIVFNLQHQFTNQTRLLPLSSADGRELVAKFLQYHLNLNELNGEQISKIDNFVTYMMPLIITITKNNQAYRSVSPFYCMYLLVLEYFINKIKQDSYLEAKKIYKSNFKYIHKIIEGYFSREDTVIPLHLYMVLEYVQNGIKDTTVKWDLIFNMHAFYERLVETKIKKIRFEDKNKMDLTKPDIQAIFQEKLDESLTKHKKLAAYTQFHTQAHDIFSQSEITEVKNSIELLKSGVEKTGLIEGVVDDRPRFVHRTFGEYLAVEYFCDILKTEQTDKMFQLLWKLILGSYEELELLDAKLSLNGEFNKVISTERHSRLIVNALLRLPMRIIIFCYICAQPLLRIKSLCISAFKLVNQNNIHAFIRFANDTAIKLHAMGCQNNDFVDAVICTAKNLNEATFFRNMSDVLKRRAVEVDDINGLADVIKGDTILFLKCIDVVYKMIQPEND